MTLLSLPSPGALFPAPVTAEADVAVIGAGVTGLAVAGELARAGRSVVVLERHAGPGRETSSRSSEVIHSGIYYPTGSLKARLSLSGNPLLYELCCRDNVDHRRLGKLIVAVEPQEVDALHALEQRGRTNGVEGLELLGRGAARRLEPRLRASGALLVPSTGIVDSHGLVKALEARARAAGALVLYRETVEAVESRAQGYRLFARNPCGRETVDVATVVNAAGLDADLVADLAGIDSYRLHWCKGDYFSLSSRVAQGLSRLVYPVPAASLTGLGVHVTRDLAGRVRLGPDASYIERGQAGALDVDPGKAQAFAGAVARFLPGIRAADLQADTAGIRPKLQGPGDPWQDFAIRDEADAGRPGWVNLVGIESPGLTSCLAVGQEASIILTRCYI